MAKRNWVLNEHPKTKRWYATIPAGIDAESYPKASEIRDEAIERGIDAFSVISEAALEKSLKKARDCAGEEFSFPVVLEPSFDVRLNITPDKTSASLYVRKATDRKIPLDLKLISTVINNSHLKGLDPARIKAEIHRFKDAPELELQDFVIASGTPPGRGKDRELISKFEWLGENERGPLLARVVAFHARTQPTADDATFPVSEAEEVARVERGQILFELSSAEMGTPGTDVFGKEIPGLPGNDPFIHLAGNLTLGPSGIKAEIGGLLLASSAEGKRRFRVVPYADGKATPIVSEDRMSVSLILESEEGAGTELDEADALDDLAKRGIKGNIDRQSIRNAIARVKTTKASEEIIILRGTAPVPPGSSRISWSVRKPQDGASVSVNAGDRILSSERLPSGADGFDVYGTALKASSGAGETLPGHDATISETSEGSLTVFAAGVSGDLILGDSGLSVSDTRTIEGNVDDTSGDVHFPGAIHLKGNVKAGRVVKAEGSLSVDGDAEAALLSANESVTMTGGIVGAGRGTVWAKQGIHLAYAENARLLAGQDILVDDYCFQCTVKTNGTLFMRGNPAVLLGGNIRASRGVEVYELGSEKTIRTSISFGQNYLVSDQIEVCEKEVEKIKQAVEKIDEEMKRISTTDPTIHELRRKKLEILKRNDKLTVRIFTLKEQYETHIISHIRVENTVYPGVILESHGRYFEVREKRTHVIFIFDQTSGQITCTPINDQE